MFRHEKYHMYLPKLLDSHVESSDDDDDDDDGEEGGGGQFHYTSSFFFRYIPNFLHLMLQHLSSSSYLAPN